MLTIDHEQCTYLPLYAFVCSATTRCTPAERAEKLQRYRAKRDLRNFKQTVKYQCRKTLADSRPRVGGRFARNDDPRKVLPHETKKAQRQRKGGAADNAAAAAAAAAVSGAEFGQHGAENGWDANAAAGGEGGGVVADINGDFGVGDTGSPSATAKGLCTASRMEVGPVSLKTGEAAAVGLGITGAAAGSAAGGSVKVWCADDSAAEMVQGSAYQPASIDVGSWQREGGRGAAEDYVTPAAAFNAHAGGPAGMGISSSNGAAATDEAAGMGSRDGAADDSIRTDVRGLPGRQHGLSSSCPHLSGWMDSTRRCQLRAALGDFSEVQTAFAAAAADCSGGGAGTGSGGAASCGGNAYRTKGGPSSMTHSKSTACGRSEMELGTGGGGSAGAFVSSLQINGVDRGSSYSSGGNGSSLSTKGRPCLTPLMIEEQPYISQQQQQHGVQAPCSASAFGTGRPVTTAAPPAAAGDDDGSGNDGGCMLSGMLSSPGLQLGGDGVAAMLLDSPGGLVPVFSPCYGVGKAAGTMDAADVAVMAAVFLGWPSTPEKGVSDAPTGAPAAVAEGGSAAAGTAAEAVAWSERIVCRASSKDLGGQSTEAMQVEHVLNPSGDGLAMEVASGAAAAGFAPSSSRISGREEGPVVSTGADSSFDSFELLFERKMGLAVGSAGSCEQEGAEDQRDVLSAGFPAYHDQQQQEGGEEDLDQCLLNAPLAAFEQVLPVRSQQYGWGKG